MPKRAKELGAIDVKQLSTPGLHAVGGVAGLALEVKPTGARSWILRAKVGSRRRHIGLGAYPDVTLAGAREAARAARKLIREGIDPVAERKRAHAALLSEQARRLTFREAARTFLKSKTAEFRNEKHAAQWSSTLETYAYPVIGSLTVDEIEVAHIVRALEPIWTTKTETASRVRGRIESVLAWATVSGFRTGDNPARWRGNLDTVLPKPTKVARVEHHPAVPIDEAAEVVRTIRSRTGNAARCLEFIILTACRSSEARGARWEEIDMDGKTWTVPAERIKAGREHVVPLSDRAVEILKRLKMTGPDLVFPGPSGKMMATESLTAVLRRIGRTETVHGFRSTFRDWCSERTNYPHEVAEMALAHAIPNKTEAAYRRGKLLAKRARLMRDWQRFIDAPVKSGEVLPLARKA
jgi:integrase